jgi:hypothetical protein
LNSLFLFRLWSSREYKILRQEQYEPITKTATFCRDTSQLDASKLLLVVDEEVVIDLATNVVKVSTAIKIDSILK